MMTGCPCSLKQDGRTPLHVACEHGNMEAAAALIGLGGADLSLRDNSGLTPLHVAVDKNHLLLAKTLMDRGAAVDTTTNVSDNLLLGAGDKLHDTLAGRMLSV